MLLVDLADVLFAHVRILALDLDGCLLWEGQAEEVGGCADASDLIVTDVDFDRYLNACVAYTIGHAKSVDRSLSKCRVMVDYQRWVPLVHEARRLSAIAEFLAGEGKFPN